MIRSRATLRLTLCIVVLLSGFGHARDAGNEPPARSSYRPPAFEVAPGVAVPRVPASADTTFLGSWTFNNQFGLCDAQGWTAVDATAQQGDYFHVDDFAGLGGGDAGRLRPLQGTKSMWCGARPDGVSPVLCGYASLPGYGNSWDQAFCTAACLSVTGDVRLDYYASWDTEEGYDFVYVEYDQCDGFWQAAYQYDAAGGGFIAGVFPGSVHDGNIRLRFHFVSDPAYSDEDGVWPTDGAFIVDSLTVRDASGVVLATELFETESVGDKDAASGNWVSCTPPAYGDFSGMFYGTGVIQDRSPCERNLSCLWGFFDGSWYDYSCGGHPAQMVVPYGNSRDQYIHNEIRSPLLAWTGAGAGVVLQYARYYDNSFNALVYGVWRVRSVVGGCPQPWRELNYMSFYEPQGWWTSYVSVDPLIDPASDYFQVALGVRDMCGVWCGVYGNGTCHSHGPLYDDVRVFRLDATGPYWDLRDEDMFQDNFAGDGSNTGTARADMAADVLPASNPNILPGDSVVVWVKYPDGLATDPYSGTGAAVYCYVTVRPRGQTAKSGAVLSEDPVRWPVVDSFAHKGDTWYSIRMDTVYTIGGAAVADKYCVDLNDNLFTPGDTVFFVFAARAGAPSNSYTYATLGFAEYGQAEFQTADLATAIQYADEFTVLPAAGLQPGGNVLYVDGMNFRGAQMYIDTAFRSLGIYNKVDRFDIRAPEASVANHPASRVINAYQQILPVYSMVIWNTGNLSTAFGDGTASYDKSDDAGLLFTFLNYHPSSAGVYLSGDDVAQEWESMYGSGAVQLKSTYMNFNVVTGAHEQAVGVSPLVVGEADGYFETVFGPDTLTAYGGCPFPNDFDLLSPAGTSTTQMSYRGKGNTFGAVLGQETVNAVANDATFILSGFSFHEIRDDDARPGELPDRFIHLERIFTAFGQLTSASGAGVPGSFANDLRQNRPNPFNPTTTIEYSIAESGHVSLVVFNVAGQLVRTLVDEVQTPETVRPVVWDGRNDAGGRVSSGVYFYRLSAEGFTRTRKMVLLK